MLTFAVAVFLLIITPGPGVLTTAGIGASFGYRAGISYVIGLMIGTNLVALAVVTGLAAIILAEPAIRTVLLFLSAAYLVYLAARIAFAGSKIAFIHKASPPGIVGGLMLQAINPKAYAVNTTLFSGFSFLSASLGFEVVMKFAIMNLIWLPIHIAWLWAGVSLHRLNLSPRSTQALNIVMALLMLGVVALAAVSNTRTSL